MPGVYLQQYLFVLAFLIARKGEAMDQFLFRFREFSVSLVGVSILLQRFVGGRAQSPNSLSQGWFAYHPRAKFGLDQRQGGHRLGPLAPMWISFLSSTSRGARRNTPGRISAIWGPLPDNSGSFGLGRPQISIGGMGGIGIGQPSFRNLRNSILAAEVAASRRLLLQLNSETTRIGVVTFGEGDQVLQPLTHDFEQVRRVLDDILRAGPYGGTNMAEGIRAAITELMGLGKSEKKTDTIKVEFLLTDGFPTMPIGGGRRAAPEDTDFAINAARLAGKAGIKVHVFALGEEALSYPRAAVGIAKASGGTYTPVSRPADVLAVVENISLVGVDYVQVVNQTTGQKATQLRLAADGFFSSAVPVAEGRNQIDVFARASDGSTKRDSVSIFYQSGNQRSLDLEVFLEREKNLKLEVERLGRSPAEIQKETEKSREDSLGRSQQLPPSRRDPQGNLA